MKCTTPEISWHNRDPVLSVDVQIGSCQDSKGETFWRVVTGGADSHVLIWYLSINEVGGVVIKCVADLERHQKAVNVVRFSPSKVILASADDESNIVLWKQKEDCDFFVPPEDNENKEQWVSWKVLRGHIEDIYDISWSPDSNSLVSGSVDNTAMLWDIHKGRSIGILSDYKGFVQGVSWDPCNQYICTISTDRLVDISTKKTVQRVHKSKIPTPPGHPLEGKTVRLFYDDTFKSFFRRLTFSLDGALIIVPSGIIEPQETTENISNATIIFSRHNLKEPIMILPSLNECTIAVRCCPVYFELQKDGPTPMIALPYRIVFAVATQHSVMIYDTQQTSPITVISNIHYTRLTDIAWSSDGRILIATSTDGYCSIIHFEENELGIVYKMTDKDKCKVSNNNLKQSSPSNKTKENEPETQRLPTFDADSNAMDIDITKCEYTIATTVGDQSTKMNIQELSATEKDKTIEPQAQVKSTDDEMVEETEDIKLVYCEESDSDIIKTNTVKNTPPKTDVPLIAHNKAPRRVKLITISSPKGFRKE